MIQTGQRSQRRSDDKRITMTVPRFEVGLTERCIRSLLRLDSMQRLAPRLASSLYNPLMAREFTIDFQGFAYRGHTNNRIDWCVYVLKNFASAEAALVRSVRNYYKRQDQPFVCMDIGANVGHGTLVMARLAETVIAIEAMPGAFRRLQEKVEANGLHHVRLFDVALNDQAGDVELEVLSPINFHACRKTSALTCGTFGVQVVKGVRGDDLLPEQKLPYPQFIKIGAASDTVRALSGLRETLSKARPIMLITCPRLRPGESIDVDGLRSVLYEDVEVFTFEESIDKRRFSFESIKPDARKIVCIPGEIVRVAELEGCKYRSHGIKVSG